MGRSGSGKTTLLRLLRGVEELDEGSITVSDVTVRAGDSQFYYNQLKKKQLFIFKDHLVYGLKQSVKMF